MTPFQRRGSRLPPPKALPGGIFGVHALASEPILALARARLNDEPDLAKIRGDMRPGFGVAGGKARAEQKEEARRVATCPDATHPPVPSRGCYLSRHGTPVQSTILYVSNNNVPIYRPMAARLEIPDSIPSNGTLKTNGASTLPDARALASIRPCVTR